MTPHGPTPAGNPPASAIVPETAVTGITTKLAGGYVPVPGRGMALTLLVLINLFNYIDRQVLAAVEPSIRTEFFTDPAAVASTVGLLSASSGQAPLLTAATLYPERTEKRDAKTRMGFLSTVFLLSYMLAAPVFGWLANRMSRWILVGIGVILWSLASGGSGLVGLYLLMILTRCCVGFGEAAYGPVAPDMIADLYPVQRRGQVLAWFFAAIPFGGALGYALGAGILDLTGSWRTAFYLVVLPGLLLGLCCFFMAEPKRGQTEQAASVERRERWSDYLILFRTPSYTLNSLGMTAMTFAMGGLAFWAPGYFQYRNVAPLWGINPTTAFGGLTALTGLAATLVGGIAGDRLKPRFPGSYFLVSGAAMILAFPMLLLMIALPFPLAWIPLVLFVFFLFFNTGPTNTILANVTHPLLRAPASPSTS